jgi:hypothetical protein
MQLMRKPIACQPEEQWTSLEQRMALEVAAATAGHGSIAASNDCAQLNGAHDEIRSPRSIHEPPRLYRDVLHALYGFLA